MTMFDSLIEILWCEITQKVRKLTLINICQNIN